MLAGARSDGKARAGRPQAGAAALILLAMLSVAGAVDRLSRSPWLEARVQAWDLRRFAAGTERMMDRGLYLDFEDRLILRDVPRLRRSRGGVHFFGTSSLKWATEMWVEPPEIQALVQNDGIGATSHFLQSQFIHFLIADEGLLAPGPDRVHVVLGLYWSMALDWNPETFFAPLWRRHGLYTYDRATGIHPARLSPALRAARTEWGRCASFLGGMFNRAARALATAAHVPLEETENIRDPAKVAAWARKLAGSPDRLRTLDGQMRDLSSLVEDLRRRGVGVSVVLLPTRRAFEVLPLPAAYRKAVLEFCSARGVPLLDLTDLLEEGDFADMNHSNAEGLGKTHRALMALARDRLRAMGLLPDEGVRLSGPAPAGRPDR